MDDDGVGRALLLRATRAASDPKAEDLAADHGRSALSGVVPGSRDGVHLASDAQRPGKVIRIGCGSLGFEAQRALPPPELRGLVECEPDRFGVAVAFVPQDREILLRALVESSLYQDRRAGSVRPVDE